MPLDQVDVDEMEEKGQKEMTFFEHIDELRKHLFRAALAVLAAGVGLYIFREWLFRDVLFGPTKPDFISYRLACYWSRSLGLGDAACIQPVQFDKLAIGFGETFIMAMKVSFIGGIFVASPIIFWEFWKFIKPGLYEKEQKSLRGVALICTFLFMAGVLFGYYIVAPFGVNFLAGFELADIKNSPTLSSYITYMLMFTAPTGLVFEMPIIVYFLARLGLATPEGMRKYRRHAIVIILIVAGIITPPDAVTQLLIGIPLVILYEISVYIAKIGRKQYDKELD